MALDWAHFTPWAVIGVVFGIDHEIGRAHV